MSAQLALFAVPPSLTDLSKQDNAHEAYQRFLMAERAGDAALLAWVKTWGRPAMEALRDGHEFGLSNADLEEERKEEIEDAVSEAESAQAAVAEDAVTDLRSALKAVNEAVGKLKTICPEGAAA